MDDETLRVYNLKAASIAARHRGNAPNHVHGLVLTHFRVGELTADVGCGSGRDTEWLHQQGYPAVGYDGSVGMLNEARRVYPTCDFRSAFLPHLAGIPDASYTNVLCNAVLMHLPKHETPIALQNLARIMHQSGCLLLSFRGSMDEAEREQDGRLFARIALPEMTRWVEAGGLRLLHAETVPDPVRTGGQWSVVVAERTG